MKKFNWIFILIAVVGFAIISCSDSSDQLTNSFTEESSFNNSGILEKEVLHFLTGSANTYNIFYQHPEFGLCIIPGPKQNGGFYNVITVNANQKRNGTFSGHFLSQFQGPVPDSLEIMFGDRVKADIIQLIVDESGTKAKVVCEITEWNGPQLPWWLVMVFVDDGEGNPPENSDAASSWWFSDQESDRDFYLSLTPQEYIDWSWAIIEPLNLPNMGPTIPIDNGNIQVH